MFVMKCFGVAVVLGKDFLEIHKKVVRKLEALKESLVVHSIDVTKKQIRSCHDKYFICRQRRYCSYSFGVHSDDCPGNN